MPHNSFVLHNLGILVVTTTTFFICATAGVPGTVIACTCSIPRKSQGTAHPCLLTPNPRFVSASVSGSEAANLHLQKNLRRVRPDQHPAKTKSRRKASSAASNTVKTPSPQSSIKTTTTTPGTHFKKSRIRFRIAHSMT